MTPATKRVLDAWNNPGRKPQFHVYMQRKLMLEWPTLFAAIRELVHENKENEE